MLSLGFAIGFCASALVLLTVHRVRAIAGHTAHLKRAGWL